MFNGERMPRQGAMRARFGHLVASLGWENSLASLILLSLMLALIEHS